MISIDEALGADTAALTSVDDLRSEVGTAQASGRHVDGHPGCHGAEATHVVKRVSQHPFGEFVDQVGLLDERDEAIRIQQSQGGVLPAHQGLDRLDRTVVDAWSWAGSAAPARPSSMALRTTRSGSGWTRRNGPAAGRSGPRRVLGLGEVHGHVGVLEQVVDVEPSSGATTNPMLDSIDKGRPLTSTSCSMIDRSRRSASSASVTSRNTIPNSSPPRRATMS